MVNSLQPKDCSGCSACAAVCPKQCIEMKPDKEGFLYPHINQDLCIKCNKCSSVCQAENKRLKLSTAFDEPKVFGAANKDNFVRMKSSSGGIFSLLAEEIIGRGGAVVGPAFDGDLVLKHIIIENTHEIERLRGSKYIQSQIDDVYKKVKKMLEDDRYVLFTGTPCQVNGLLNFLGKDYEKLFTQDLICHGVPSAKVWETYLNRQIEKYGEVEGNIINFRSKTDGWMNFSLTVPFKSGKILDEPKDRNAYLKAFLADICLRPSCYNCHNKGFPRNSDITLADFWAVKKLKPELFNDAGTSLIFLNTEKGAELFSHLKEKMISEEVELSSLKPYIGSAYGSVSLNKNREKFMKRLDGSDFGKISDKYSKDPLSLRIKVFVAAIINKILGRKSMWD